MWEVRREVEVVVVEGVMEEEEKREECASLRRETGSSGMRCLGGEGRGLLAR